MHRLSDHANVPNRTTTAHDTLIRAFLSSSCQFASCRPGRHVYCLDGSFSSGSLTSFSSGSLTSLSTIFFWSCVGSFIPCLKERIPWPSPFMSSGNFLPPKRRSATAPIRISSVVPIMHGAKATILPHNIVKVIEVVVVIVIVAVIVVIVIVVVVAVVAAVA